MHMRRLAVWIVVLPGLSGPCPASAEDITGGPAEFRHLQYRSIGPVGGRVCRAAGVPGDPLTYYAAAASGGLWKSTDGGTRWKPIFDDQPVSSVGSLAIASSNPNVIYLGTGEGNIRGNVAAGNGIYKSLDGGQTWKHVWKQTGQVGQMIVHPTNPDIAFAAVLGHVFGPNPQRGIYRTRDGGQTWQWILNKDPDTGACDVCFDPSNPNIVYAGLWQTRRRPWEYTSGGPGSGLYLSRDGGDTWKQLGGTGVKPDDLKGLPDGIWGKVGIAVAPSDGRRVYALIEADKGGLYRSDDGGESWKLINAGRYLRQRPWYFSTITVDPRNPDVVWCPQVRLLRSIDGGGNFQQVKGTHHVDHHDLWIDPKDPRRMIDSNDGGVDISVNGGTTWNAPPLPICQFYHVNADSRLPYHVSGNMQDMGTASGPSNSLNSSGIEPSDWYSVGGGETGFTFPDPSDPNVVYAGEYGGFLSRFDFRTRQARNVSIYPTNPSGRGAEELRYRFQWTAPILISPHDSRTLYHGANVLFRSIDGGQRWEKVSDDLTRNDRTKQKWSGGPITGDNTGAEYYCTLFALAESRVEKGVLWTGSDDGLVHISRDNGKTWTNVTADIPGLPEWGTVRCIEPSPFDPGTAYVVVDAHRLDNTRPYLYVTTDFGKTWKSLTGNLPGDVYLHVVRADPKRKGLLFLGTERGVRFSTDHGGSWRELRLNLPTVAVHDLIVKDNDLVVGTNGRSIWIFDDLTPLRVMNAEIASETAHLFSGLPAIRWRYHANIYWGPAFSGKNPPEGAVIDYYLKEKPKDPIALEVRDGKGALIRRFSSKPEPPDLPPDHPDGPEEPKKKPVLPTEAGINRFVWDLGHAGPELIKGAKIDGGEAESGPLVLPGTYTLTLLVGAVKLSSSVKVEPDLRLQAPVEALAEQLALTLATRDDISRLTGLVNQVRSLKKQLAIRKELLKENTPAKEMHKRIEALTASLDALEGQMHNPRAEVSYDILAQRGGAKLYSQMVLLFHWLKEADGAPTQGMQEVRAEQVAELKRLEGELNKLIDGEVARLNELGKKWELPLFVP